MLTTGCTKHGQTQHSSFSGTGSMSGTLCCSVLVFQTTQEWEGSDLGLHPVQVALQIAIPELDGAIEPIVLSGRDDASK